MKRRFRIPILVIAVATVLFATTAAYPSGKDTVESVMAMGKEGVSQADATMAYAKAAQGFSNKIATDKVFAGKLLAAIQKSDAAAIATMAKEGGMPGTITVSKIVPDFHFELSVGHYLHHDAHVARFRRRALPLQSIP